MYELTECSNGVRIVSHSMLERDSIALGFWIGVGGRFEPDEVKGAAHFVEHIVFKGTKKYSCDEIKQKIEGVGGSLNAFTSEEQTCFYAKIPSRHLLQTFDVLSDMVLAPQIATKDVAKERTVISEEIKMYHDVPHYFVLDMLDKLVWSDHPLGKNIAGNLTSVGAMTSLKLKQFHRQFYVPENIVVAAAGKVNHKSLVDLVQRKFAFLKKQPVPSYVPVSPTTDVAKLGFDKRPIEQTHMALGMPGYHEMHPDRYVMSLLNVMLGGNMSSRLFVEVREKRGLAYSISSSIKTLHDTGLFYIRAGVDNAKAVDALRVVIRELNKIRKTGVADEELSRAREYLIGQLQVGLEDTMDHMLWVGESVSARNKIRTLKRVVAKLRRVTPYDIKRVAKDVLNPNRFRVSVVGPVQKGQIADLKSLLGI